MVNNTTRKAIQTKFGNSASMLAAAVLLLAVHLLSVQGASSPSTFPSVVNVTPPTPSTVQTYFINVGNATEGYGSIISTIASQPLSAVSLVSAPTFALSSVVSTPSRVVNVSESIVYKPTFSSITSSSAVFPLLSSSVSKATDGIELSSRPSVRIQSLPTVLGVIVAFLVVLLVTIVSVLLCSSNFKPKNQGQVNYTFSAANSFVFEEGAHGNFKPSTSEYLLYENAYMNEQSNNQNGVTLQHTIQEHYEFSPVLKEESSTRETQIPCPPQKSGYEYYTLADCTNPATISGDTREDSSHPDITDSVRSLVVGNSSQDRDEVKEETEQQFIYEDNGFIVPNKEKRDDSDLNDSFRYDKLTFFENNKSYWLPANSSDALYDQLAAKMFLEIPKKEIKMLSYINSGQFGVVSKARWTSPTSSVLVAVKQISSTASTTDRLKLLQEGAIMGQFQHKHIVKLYGLITITNPICLCLEYMSNGDLRSFLCSMKSKKNDIPNGHSDIRVFFLQAARDIASGMSYLSKKSFVHRDLAARNVLLNDSYVCKISDFGMSRDLISEVYYMSGGGGMIPVRWTAPEALLNRKYSSASDVWSFAMVLYEIWSLGEQPFPSLDNTQVIAAVVNQLCQPPPPGCPTAVYKLMTQCWNPDHQQRPRFEDILAYLQQPAADLISDAFDDSTNLYSGALENNSHAN